MNEYIGNLSAALGFVREYGLPVFPALTEPAGDKDAKAPHIRNPFAKASVDPEKIKCWWRQFNEQCAFAAYPGAAGFAVVDLDNHKGKDGAAELSKWENAHEKLPATFRVRTPSGGLHLWFKSADLTGAKDGLFEGVDVHGGPGSDGKYVLLPGQRIKTGEYIVEEKPPFAELPKSFAKEVNRAREGGNKPSVPAGAPTLPPGEWSDFATILGEVMSMKTITANRDNTLTALACDWKERGVPPEAQVQLMETMNGLGKIEQTPGDEKDTPDFLRITGSVWKREQTVFGSQTLKQVFGSPEDDPRRRYYSAAELPTMKLEPPRFIVEGLLPEGLSMIVGGAKSGKTYLNLQIAVAVASGGKFLDLYTCPKGRVLYYYLEGDASQVMDRFLQIYDDPMFQPPKDLTVTHWCPPLNVGGWDYVSKAIEKYRPTLIIWDTWQKVRSNESGKLDAYQKQYAELNEIREMTYSRYGASSLLAHHFNQEGGRKRPADPYTMINGSAALSGASDALLLLFRDRGAETAELSVSGRSVRDQTLELIKVPGEDRMGWMASTDRPGLVIVPQTELQERILQSLKDCPDGITAENIARAHGIKAGSVRQQLIRWEDAGHLDKPKRGIYRLWECKAAKAFEEKVEEGAESDKTE